MPHRSPTLTHIKLTNIVMIAGMRPAYAALIHQLNLRNYYIKHRDIQPRGLAGFVLEGEPGVGKSLLVLETLLASGLTEGKDFCFIPVSWSYEQKETALLQAFHQGMVAIVEEFNSSPMMERLLNALLDGHDLSGHIAKAPGFRLFATQNPPTNKGRIKTTLPIKHRVQTIVIEPPTLSEMKRYFS